MFEYREIGALYLHVPNLNQKMSIQERWSFKFTLVTSKRVFDLYAASMDERNLWIHTFTWILARNHYSNEQSYITTTFQPKGDEI